MNIFTYEEQDDKKYLVYKMQAEDSLDKLTLEMMSNNRIQGLLPSNHIQIDDCLYMKYDITGLKSLREYLQGVVNREKLLGILESIADAIMIAEDYMLKLSSYVLDEEYIYVEPHTKKVLMTVLPITRNEISIEIFLKELLTDIQYDQGEDCSYVISLINLLGSSNAFSVSAFKEQTVRLKKSNTDVKKSKEKIASKPIKAQFPDISPVEEINQASVSVKEIEKNIHDIERKQALDVLFSNEDEESLKKEKKGLFFKKEKSEKNKRAGFWGRLIGSRKEDGENSSDIEPIMGGIAIPGMDVQSQVQKGMNLNGKENDFLHEKSQKQDIAIPAQNVEMNRTIVDMYDFGETVFIGETEDDETFILGQEREIQTPKFTLYRCSTKESFKISEEVTRIGRSSSIAEVCISGNRSVGRVHALLYIRDGQAFIEDNNSKNKTYVDGIQLELGESPHRLTHGSKIRLGDEELEFYIQE